MTDFNKFFTTYELTDPPPIIPKDYTISKENYRNNIEVQYLQNSQSENVNLQPSTEPVRALNDVQSVPQPSQKNTNLDVVNLARTFIGSKYTWGGQSPKTGFDCSGLIHYVYKENGINIPRTSKELASCGFPVQSLQDVKEGDIIYQPGSGPSGGHVKIVSKVDNGQIYTIEAKGSKYGVVETPLTDTNNIKSIRRVLPDQYAKNIILNYFIGKGLTPNQAKGIYGNLMQESGGNINALSKDGNNSFGIAQWTGSRKAKLFNKYGVNPSLQDQLDFMWEELNTSEKKALNALMATSTVEDATKSFMSEFERPNTKYANFSRRLQYANNA